MALFLAIMFILVALVIMASFAVVSSAKHARERGDELGRHKS